MHGTNVGGGIRQVTQNSAVRHSGRKLDITQRYCGMLSDGTKDQEIVKQTQRYLQYTRHPQTSATHVHNIDSKERGLVTGQ